MQGLPFSTVFWARLGLARSMIEYQFGGHNGLESPFRRSFAVLTFYDAISFAGDT
jgi:hypothetical protein